MLIYAGIDEAGYGPLLGPLCVAMATMTVDADPADGAPDLWDRADAVICRKGRDPKRRIAIDDSKKLKGSNSARTHPLTHLERGVLAALLATQDGGPLPADDDALFAAVGGALPGEPWYVGAADLPVAHDPGSLRIDAARFRRGLADAGIAITGLAVDIVDAGRLNAGIERTGSKAEVNLDAALTHAESLRGACGQEHPRLVIDRHGGRTRYAGVLRRRWPDDEVEVLVEHPSMSRYRLRGPSGEITISFVRGGDERHLPIALASMAAKYVRELAMARLNRYFAGGVSDLRPTAGYVQDGRRFLEEVAPVIEAERLDRGSLIRQA